MTKTFYCDVETHKLIEEARKLNPEFNLSLFIKNSLRNIACEEKKLDLDFIKFNIDKLEKDEEKIQGELNYWKGQEIKYYQLLQSDKQKEKEQKEHTMFLENINKFLDNITPEQEKEYREGLPNKWKTYYQFAKRKLFSDDATNELQDEGGRPSS